MKETLKMVFGSKRDSLTMHRHERARYLKVIEAQFEAHQTPQRIVDFLERTFKLPPDQASVIYQDFVDNKRRKYRLVVGVVLLSGLVSMTGLMLMSNTSEFSVSLRGLSFALMPGILLSPVLAWASYRHWRSADRDLLDALQTFAVYYLVVVAFTLNVGFGIVLLFEIVGSS